MHPTLALSKEGYGSYCSAWTSGQPAFCYTDADCPSATLDATTGWNTVECTCAEGSAGGSTCDEVPTGNNGGYSYSLVLQGDTGVLPFDQWYEFSTARDNSYIIHQIEGDVHACSQACSLEPTCLGFQLETLGDATVQCTLLNDLGRRVRTAAETKSFIAVVSVFFLSEIRHCHSVLRLPLFLHKKCCQACFGPVCHFSSLPCFSLTYCFCLLSLSRCHSWSHLATRQSYNVSVVSSDPQLRFANAYDVNHQVFTLRDVADINTCVDACGQDVYCQAVHIAQCPDGSTSICIGLNQPGALVPKEHGPTASVLKTVRSRCLE